MSNNFTKQALAKAIVPLQLGKIGPYREQWDGQFTLQNPVELRNREQWNVLWGIYAFRDANNPSHPWAYAEASMLLSEYMHDFCGGVIASSANVRMFYAQPLRDRWGEVNDQRVARLVPRPFNKPNLLIPQVTVPSIHDALFLDRPMHFAEVEEIMRRSMMFWAMSYLFALGKRGMICMDRSADNGGNSRLVLRAAKQVTWIASGPIYNDTDAMRVNPTEALIGEPTTYRPYSMWVGTPQRYDVQAACDEGALWINYNSSNFVGPVQAYFTTAKNFKTQENLRDEDDDVEYDEEADEYRRVERPIPDEEKVELPEWYTKVAHTLQHVRMFPRVIFNN